MARRLTDSGPWVPAVRDLVNGLKTQIGAGSHFHLDASEVVVTFADLTDENDTTALLNAVNELKAVYEYHIADTLAHKVALADPGLVKATTLATAYTLVNAIKTSHNSADGSTTYHYNADTNDEATTNASTPATLLALCNALKATLNTHMADAPSGQSVRVVDA